MLTKVKKYFGMYPLITVTVIPRHYQRKSASTMINLGFCSSFRERLNKKGRRSRNGEIKYQEEWSVKDCSVITAGPSDGIGTTLLMLTQHNYDNDTYTSAAIALSQNIVKSSRALGSMLPFWNQCSF